MIIKVCGMKDPQNIQEVSGLGVDWIGVIFYSKSPRRFGIMDNGQWTMDNEKDINNSQLSDNVDLAKRKAIVNCQLSSVGVFVNATFEEIIETVNSCRLNYVQLHGDESPEFCFALQKRGISLIKAISVSSREDVEKIREYDSYIDYFLFDTKCKEYGGSGKQFDWSVLSAYKGETPFLLSGGINPASIEALRHFIHPRWAGIDLNSGFEIEPGLKDIEKLKVFIDAFREAFKK